jgi:hypothetical protein
MDAKEFVASWKSEKSSYLQLLKSDDLLVSKQIAALGLTPIQLEQLWVLLDTVLTDTMYTLLLGLDGSASIGGTQHAFQIRDESGNIVAASGALEDQAYEQFQGSA